MRGGRKNLKRAVEEEFFTLQQGDGCERPEVFKPTAVESSKQHTQSDNTQMDDNEDSSDDDGLPPLEANTNRPNPFHQESEIESDSDTDS